VVEEEEGEGEEEGKSKKREGVSRKKISSYLG